MDNREYDKLYIQNQLQLVTYVEHHSDINYIGIISYNIAQLDEDSHRDADYYCYENYHD